MTDVVKKWITDWAGVTFTTNVFDAMAIDEFTAMSDELNNITLGKAIFCDLHVSLGSATWTGADSAIEIYLSAPGNADVYPEWAGAGAAADEQENNQLFVGSVTTAGAGTVTQDLYLRDVELPPGKFKLAIRNKTGVALNASNNLYYRLWSHGSA